MAADHLAIGRVVRPFSVELSTPLVFTYFLLRPNDRQDDPKVSCFREWLLEEAQRTEDSVSLSPNT